MLCGETMLEGLAESHRKRRVTTDKSDHSKETPPDLETLNPDDWEWSSSSQLSASVIHFIDPKSVVFHPKYSYGTAAIIGERALTKDIMAFWEVHVQFVYGTSMMFGIGQKCSKLVSPVIFENLTGNDSYSYGLSHKGVIYHNRDESSYCEPFKEREEVTVGVLFDGPNRQLSYFVNGVFMGVAFHDIDLNENVYYPMISSTSQKSHFTVSRQKYKTFVTSLFELCFTTITKLVKTDAPNFGDINRLGLPEKLSKMIKNHINASISQQATPMKRKKLNNCGIESDSEFQVELFQDLMEPLMKLAWSQSMSSQL